MNKKYPTFFLTWFYKILRVPYPGYRIPLSSDELSRTHMLVMIAEGVLTNMVEK